MNVVKNLLVFFMVVILLHCVKAPCAMAAGEVWQGALEPAIMLAVRNPEGRGLYFARFEVVDPRGKTDYIGSEGNASSLTYVYVRGAGLNGEYKWKCFVGDGMVASGSYTYDRSNEKVTVLTLGKVTSGWYASQEIILRLGLRNKVGNVGDDRKVEMVVTGPDKEYRATNVMRGNRMADFVFPIEFGRLTSEGEYTWTSYQNGQRAMSGTFTVKTIESEYDQLTVYYSSTGR